jgi:HSP20 family protein
LDLPGVPANGVRVLIKGNVVLVAGEKWADAPASGAGGYHLVERGSGRFARAVRVTGAFDGSKVRATLSGGELRITLPKLSDRRGRAIEVPVTGGSPTPNA